MEKEKSLVHDLREMVDSRHGEGCADGEACILLAREGDAVTTFFNGSGGLIATLLLNLVIREDKGVRDFLPMMCATFMAKPENALLVGSLLHNGGEGLKMAVDVLMESLGKKEE